MTHLHSSRDTIDNARTAGPGLNHSGSTPHRPRLQTEHDVRAGEVMPWRVGQRARRHEEVLHPGAGDLRGLRMQAASRPGDAPRLGRRWEETPSEVQSLMSNSYAGD